MYVHQLRWAQEVVVHSQDFNLRSALKLLSLTELTFQASPSISTVTRLHANSLVVNRLVQVN